MPEPKRIKVTEQTHQEIEKMLSQIFNKPYQPTTDKQPSDEEHDCKTCKHVEQCRVTSSYAAYMLSEICDAAILIPTKGQIILRLAEEGLAAAELMAKAATELKRREAAEETKGAKEPF